MADYTGPSLREVAPGVTVDLTIRGGHPCVKGTAVLTAKVWQAFEAGRSIRALAKDHRVSEQAIEQVIRYEMTQHKGDGLKLAGIEPEEDPWPYY